MTEADEKLSWRRSQGLSSSASHEDLRKAIVAARALAAALRESGDPATVAPELARLDEALKRLDGF